MVVFVELLLLQWIVDLTNAPNKSLSIQLMMEKDIAMTMSLHEFWKAVKNKEGVEVVELGRSVGYQYIFMYEPQARGTRYLVQSRKIRGPLVRGKTGTTGRF